MALSPGARLGPYEIVSLLGEGGMGQVYRARDTQLGRDVAIKILPGAFAADPDRLMRFEREARTLATLNHAHIAQVYGLESSGASRAIVMELVEGATLADVIAQHGHSEAERVRARPRDREGSVTPRRGWGPGANKENERVPERPRDRGLDIDDALSIARQIADALEAAHEQGIIHRDLKPANVKLRPDGIAKVLDFGLAKALAPDAGASATSDIANSPTMTSPAMTQAGIILGTAAYMAPEQARGKAVDRRADIWALGCVLFEMLTSSRPFDGETITDVLSAVVSKEPDWSKLPATTPPAVIRLMRRCLRKDVRTRLQSAGDARVELDEALAGSPEASAAPLPAARKTGWLPAVAFMTAGAAIALLAVTLMQPRATVTPTNPPVMRYTIALPSSLTSVGPPTISPDGRWIAIAAIGPRAGGGAADTQDVTMAIWLRPMNALTFQPIAGTELGINPIWSPDSRELLFFARSGLHRIAITGGTPTRLAEVVMAGGPSAAWGSNGTILVSTRGQIYRMSANGGTLTQVTTVDAASNAAHVVPSWLSGDRFLFTEFAGAGLGLSSNTSSLMMQSLAGGTPTRVIEGRTLARYTPQALLAARMTVTGVDVATISAHRFDLERGTVDQPGVVLAADVSPVFGVSNTGVLVYRRATSGADHRFEWVDSKGQAIGDRFDVSGSGAFNLSRDERLVAFQEGEDIVVRDLDRGVTERVVQGPGVLEPILSPDGRRVAYSRINPPQPGIAIRPTAGGAEEFAFRSAEFPLTLVEDWSRDGRFLLGIQSTGRRSPNRGVIIPLDTDQKPVVFADLPVGATLDEPRFSPDGKWIVYNAADTGRQQVYVTPVPPTGERWQLSTDGGAQGRWRSDGRTVFYLSASGQLMEVTMNGERPPQIGKPRMLFDTGLEMVANVDQYLPNNTGTRFLLRRPRGAAGSVELQVIVNWPTLLE
jgi:serine/threonine protein kinase